MEIRARYVLVGVFVLAIIVAAGGFLFWLWGFGGLSERTAYEIRFTGTVSGLSPGSEVLFNGITVGEVTSLNLDPDEPADVIVTIAVDKRTPVRTDTRGGMAYSGLTGAARIALSGGAADAPALTEGNPPRISADNAALGDLTDAAKDTLGDIDSLIVDNADTVHTAIDSINTFAAALARNSDKINSIVAGISQLTGGSSSNDYALHDLAAPMVAAPATLPDAQLVVARPTSVVALSTQRVLLQTPDGDTPVFDQLRWADALPILVQARTIEAFEGAGYAKVVSDAGLSMGDYQLDLDLRAFHIVTDPMTAGEVTIAAKLLDSSGKVLDSKSFTDAEPLANKDDAGAAVAALNAAYGKVTSDMVGWSFAAMAAAPPPAPAAPEAPAASAAPDAQPGDASAPPAGVPDLLSPDFLNGGPGSPPPPSKP